MKNQILPVIELFCCCQGEGKLMGVPHILIRTTGCRLRCEFKNSLCDTYYASYSPEKGKYTWEDIKKIYKNNRQIKYTIISGGEPFLHKEFLSKLCDVAFQNDNYVTVETSGTDFVEAEFDLLSLSPKLSNSIPNKNLELREIHEKWRKNYDVMLRLIQQQNKRGVDCQVKFVVSEEKDLKEIKEVIKILNISNQGVWLMPEGIFNEQLKKKRKWLVELCIKEGFNYSDRLQILIYDNKRGV